MRYTIVTILGAALLFSAGCDQQKIVSPENPDAEHSAYRDQDVGLAKAATSREFSATLYDDEFTDPGAVRQTGNVTHIRHLTIKGHVNGDFSGSFDANVYDLETVRQENKKIIETTTIRGTFAIDVAELFGTAVDGAWEGRVHVLSQLYANGSSVYSASFTAKGTGDLEGLKMTGTSVPLGPLQRQLRGRILDPKGERF